MTSKTLLSFIVLTCSVFLFSSCDDIYDGNQRNIIEGSVTYQGQPLTNEEISVYAFDLTHLSSDFDINPDFQLLHQQNISISEVAHQTTDHRGHFLFGVPGGTSKVYLLGIKGRFYGYISHKNRKNHYFNAGELIIPTQPTTH